MTDDTTLPENNLPAGTIDKTKDGDQKPESVPLDKFLEQKKKNKELAEKLASYEDRDKKTADAKLLEEKNYQELIQLKEKEATDAKAELEKTKKEAKLDKIKDKFSRVLEKNNAVNADDVLRFINVDEVLEADDVDSEIKKRVDELLKNKSYLFSKQPAGRNPAENGQPVGGNAQPNQGGKSGQKVDPILLSLAQKFKI